MLVLEIDAIDHLRRVKVNLRETRFTINIIAHAINQVHLPIQLLNLVSNVGIVVTQRTVVQKKHWVILMVRTILDVMDLITHCLRLLCVLSDWGK